ncbi:hypothetical protein [Actinomyces naeslundii]|uniref:hypothetical protein n=1 Tax=Actinomyces naeslundii TaxID=1655 RepID=UPI0028F033AE|nr:hypothetical protein [Actinomyces naeslundii]
MTNEELSQQIAALTATITEKFNEIDGRLDKLQAGQDDLATKYDSLKAGQDDLVTKYDDLKAGQDDLIAKYDGLASKYDELKAGQDDLIIKYDGLKAGQDDLVTKYDELKAGQDDLRTKYGEMNEKQGHIVNAQKTIAKMQADLQHTVEEQGAKLEEDFTDMKAVQASIQHDIARINRKMVVETGVRDTMHESVFTTQDSHYRDLDRRLRLVEAHFPELGQQGA